MEIRPSESRISLNLSVLKILGYRRIITAANNKEMITSLGLSLLLTGDGIISSSGEVFMDSVFLTPSGVRSNIQDSMMVIGKPTISRMIRKVTVQSGNPSLGNIISAASMMMNAVAAYMVITLMTFRRFSSCQIWDSLLGLAGI